MSKQIKSIVIAAAALILVAGLIIAVKSIPEKNDDKLPNTELIDVVNLSSEDVLKIEVKNSKGSYEISKDNDKGYKLNGDDSLPVEQNYLSSAFSSLTHQYATTIISSDIENLSEYGLDLPSTVRIDTVNGPVVYHVGAKNPIGSGNYCYVEGKDEIVLLSSTPNFAIAYSSNEFITTNVTPVISTDSHLTDFAFEGIGREGIFKGRAKNEQDNENTGVFSSYLQTEPVVTDLTDEKVSDKIFKPYSTMKPTVAAIIKPTSNDFERCGLKNPYYRFSFTLDGNKYGFSVGNQNPDGYRYFYADGIDIIYLIEDGLVQFMNVKSVDVMDRILYLRYIDSFESIVITKDNNKYEFTLSGEKDSLIAKLNGTTVNTDDFRELFQLIIGTFVQGEAVKTKNASLYAAIEFTRRDGIKDYYNFYTMDERKLYLELNGKSNFYCSKEDADKIFKQLDKLK